MEDIIRSACKEHHVLTNDLIENQTKKISEIAKIISNSIISGGTIYWLGNGGSASDSQHLAAELIGRFNKNRIPLKSLSLNSDTSVITCISNDFGYDQIFSRQIEALGIKEDVIIGISTSGNSKNVINGIKKSNELGITTIGLLGKNGGVLKDIVNYSIIINSMNTARIQELHIFIGHLLCELIEKELKID